MEAIFLVGGLGTRLRSIVPDCPKPMADVCGSPFLQYLLEGWIERGVKHIILATGYLSENIRSFFRDEWQGIPISYSIEDQLLGTGGALKKASQYLQSAKPFLLLNGDTYFFPHIPEIRGKITIILRNMEDVSRYGSVILGEGGKIVEFKEKKPGKGLINGGVYIIDPSLLLQIPENRPISLEKELLPIWREELYGIESDADFIDIGTPSDYLCFCNQVEI